MGGAVGGGDSGTAPAGTVVLVLTTDLDPAGVAALCRRLERSLAGGGLRHVVCDAGAVRKPDLAVVDVVARLQLVAGRRGHRLRLVRAGGELRELLVLAGLDEVVPPARPPQPSGPPRPSG